MFGACGGTASTEQEQADHPGAQCVPGLQISCGCAGGAPAGTQICGSDFIFGLCVCTPNEAGDSPRNRGDAANDGAMDAGDANALKFDASMEAGLDERGENDGSVALDGDLSVESGGDVNGNEAADGGNAMTDVRVETGWDGGDDSPDTRDGFELPREAGRPDATSAEAAGCDLGSVAGTGSLVMAGSSPSGPDGCDVSLPGKIERVAYNAIQHVAYGLDSANRRIARIDLATGSVKYRTVPQNPNAACVAQDRGMLYVVNSGSTFIGEYDLTDLTLIRNIPWPAPTYNFDPDVHYHVYCGAERLYVVDANWAPGLWTIENLDGCPTAVDHSVPVSKTSGGFGVGDLVLSDDETEFYFWEQYGWSAGNVSTAVDRVATTDWSTKDRTTITYPGVFYRDPLDAPVLWHRRTKAHSQQEQDLQCRESEPDRFFLPEPERQRFFGGRPERVRARRSS